MSGMFFWDTVYIARPEIGLSKWIYLSNWASDQQFGFGPRVKYLGRQIRRSRDRWRHATRKGQTRDPNIFDISYKNEEKQYTSSKHTGKTARLASSRPILCVGLRWWVVSPVWVMLQQQAGPGLDATPLWRHCSSAAPSSLAGHPTRSPGFSTSSATASTSQDGSTTSPATACMRRKCEDRDQKVETIHMETADSRNERYFYLINGQKLSLLSRCNLPV